MQAANNYNFIRPTESGLVYLSSEENVYNACAESLKASNSSVKTVCRFRPSPTSQCESYCDSYESLLKDMDLQKALLEFAIVPSTVFKVKKSWES